MRRQLHYNNRCFIIIIFIIMIFIIIIVTIIIVVVVVVGQHTDPYWELKNSSTANVPTCINK